MDTTQRSEPSYAQLALGLDPNQALRTGQALLVAAHKPAIARALRELETELEKLALEVAHAGFGVVFVPRYNSAGEHTSYARLDQGPALAAAATAYTTIMLSPTQAANTPLRCVGVVGVEDLSTYQLAIEVNNRKQALKDALAQVGNHTYLATIYVDGVQLVRKIPLALYILRQLEAASLNRLGAYRQIPLVGIPPQGRLPATPRSIGFSEQWVKSQARATLNELIATQHAAGRLDLVERLERSGIPGDEFLYEPKPHYLRMRAHYTTEHSPPGQYERTMAELPLLFVRRRNTAWPSVTAPRPRTESRPRARKAHALEATPVAGAPGFFRRQDPAARERLDPAKPPKRTEARSA